MVLAAAVDLTQAFDRVDINLLVEKLVALGFSDSAYVWVHYFLSDRSQVVVGPSGEASAPLTKNAGIPQGSLNGPPFFSLLMNDVSTALHNCSHHLYADDLTIYCRGKSSEINKVIEKVQSDLNNLQSWAQSNGLTINVKKTQAIWFGSSYFVRQSMSSAPTLLSISGEPVPYSDSVKILGVVLDSSLTWSFRAAITTKKCFAALSRLRKCQNCHLEQTKLILVKTLVFPYLDYCAGLFLDMSTDICEKLQRCKNAALRFAFGLCKFDHISHLYPAHDILSFTARRDYLCICLMASILRNGEPWYLTDKFAFRQLEKTGSKRCSPLDLLPPKLRALYKHVRFKQALLSYALSIDK